MNIIILLVFCCFLNTSYLHSQDYKVLAGPMIGHFTDSTEHFWMLVQSSQKIENQEYWFTGFNNYLNEYFYEKGGRIEEIKQCSFLSDRKIIVSGVIYKSQKESKKENWSFLIGSCAFSYPFALLSGKRKEMIYRAMEDIDKDFMIWMGDNVYYLLGDWKHEARMHKMNLKMRQKPELNKFLMSCPQYATWDDHDFGPNNSGIDNPYKYATLKLFKEYWPNPSYGLDSAEGVFTSFKQQDAEFFLLDSRFYASDTTMLGEVQTKWLQEKLKASTANFKFIVSGTQILIDNPTGEDLGDFGSSRKNLLDFIISEKISGVMFLSGDRHYAEILKLEQNKGYPFYEITSSPLTSIINPIYTKDSLLRLPNTLIREQNFAKISVSGFGENRKCRVDFFDKNGAFILGRDIFLAELK